MSNVTVSFKHFLALGGASHCEFFDGQMHVNRPSHTHQQVQARMVAVLKDACPVGYIVLPECGWSPLPETVFEPDIMVVAADQRSVDTLKTVPLLVVEVLSPATWNVDMRRKRDLYRRGGLGCFWVVDPDAEMITVMQRDKKAVIMQDAHHPDVLITRPFRVEVNLAGLFAA